MKKIFLSGICITIMAGLLSCSRHTATPDTPGKEHPADSTGTQDSTSLKYRALHGATIQIDPSFPYYQHRSNESIVDEIALAGYTGVHYFVVNEQEVNGPLIAAFHKRGMPVWLMVVGNGTYSTKGLPAGWEQWKMEMTREKNGEGFTFFSLFNKDFAAWKKQSLVKLLTDYPFDGVEMAETYFPEWDAIRTGRYGDVGPVAQAAFKEKYNLGIPEFNNASAANFYTKIPEIYKKWMQFRVDGVTDFLDEIYNGAGGVRATHPNVLVATWSLVVDAGPNSVEKVREDHGLDVVEIVGKVKPDAHFFQTHWPDWIKTEKQLPPDYMKAYNIFTGPVHAPFPDLPLGFQADQGSGKDMIKSAAWVHQFNEAVPKYGYATWTTYEYHLGGYIYAGAPVPLKAVQQGNDSVIVSFSKRIDETSGSNLANYKLMKEARLQDQVIKKITVDGNRAIIELNTPLTGTYSLVINNIGDTPALRLYKDTPLNTMEKQQEIAITKE